MLNRRQLMARGAAGATAVALMPSALFANPHAEGTFPVRHTPAEWKQLLTKDEYYILREAGTERAGTSPLNEEKRKGVFACAGCNNGVYTSANKFDSGTGWPSFTRAVEGAVGYSEDKSLFMTRTEVHCADCGGHLGHVFDDGPPPTGKRHCINGVALDFIPSKTA